MVASRRGLCPRATREPMCLAAGGLLLLPPHPERDVGIPVALVVQVVPVVELLAEGSDVLLGLLEEGGVEHVPHLLLREVAADVGVLHPSRRERFPQRLLDVFDRHRLLRVSEDALGTSV